MPALQTNSSYSRETIYGQMRRLASRAFYDNPHTIDPATDVPRLASGGDIPVISQTSFTTIAAIRTGGYPTEYSYSAAMPNVLIYPTGGFPAQKYIGAGNPWYFAAVTNGLPNGAPTGGNINMPGRPGLSQQAFRIRFRADASKLVLAVNGYSGWRIIVNGRYVDLTGVKTATATVSPLLLDWTGSGGRAKRDVIIEGYGAGGVPAFYGVYCQATEGLVSMSKADRLTMIVCGDSITASTGLPANAIVDNFAYVAGDCLGVSDVRAAGLGGTGYVGTSGGNTWAWPQHMFDVTDINPDIVVFACGTNDNGSFPIAQILSAAGSCFDQVRAKLPVVPIFVLGLIGGGTTSGLSPFEDAFAALVAGRNDPNLFLIPVLTDPAPWLTGSGNACAPTGDGNSDFYIGSVISGNATIVNGGSGHAVNDLIDLPQPDPQGLRITLKVTSVSGGVITGTSIQSAGNYATKPANPVAQAATTGAGTGATFNINWGSAAPHCGFRAYQHMGERLAAAMLSAISGKA